MNRIPSELLDYKQWVLWRRAEVKGRTMKIPISPWSGKSAACDKPQTWSAYKHVRFAQRRFQSDGIGFVFTEADPFCGVDLDQCRSVNGTLTPEALSLIKRLDSYTELSPSGTGAHVLIKAKLAGRRRRTRHVEIYDSGRYFTITSKHLTGTPCAIHDRQSVLKQLESELFTEDTSATLDTLPPSLSLSDEEVIERAINARNGDRFRPLWNGDVSNYENDHSRADMALCRMLAFWCGGNSDQIDRLFRRSGLMRNKWDRQTGNLSYGARTIETALQNS